MVTAWGQVLIRLLGCPRICVWVCVARREVSWWVYEVSWSGTHQRLSSWLWVRPVTCQVWIRPDVAVTKLGANFWCVIFRMPSLQELDQRENWSVNSEPLKLWWVVRVCKSHCQWPSWHMLPTCTTGVPPKYPPAKGRSCNVRPFDLCAGNVVNSLDSPVLYVLWNLSFKDLRN